MKKTILLLLTLTSLISYVSTQKVMDSWLGSTKQQLIMSWGPAARTSSDGANGEILVYARQVYRAPQNSTFYSDNGSSSTSYSPGVNYWDYSMFFINSEGKIYHWLKQRQQIPPQQIDLSIYFKN